jgi:hypothetical protein
MTRNQKLKERTIVPDACISASASYVTEWGPEQHVVEFFMNSLYVNFQQEETVVLKTMDSRQTRMLILLKRSEGELTRVRGLVMSPEGVL